MFMKQRYKIRKEHLISIHITAKKEFLAGLNEIGQRPYIASGRVDPDGLENGCLADTVFPGQQRDATRTG